MIKITTPAWFIRRWKKPPDNPLAKYPGQEWGNHGSVADWILSHLPSRYAGYLEPFSAYGALLLRKPPAKYEHLNDVDSNVIRFCEVVRKYGPEVAREVRGTMYGREALKTAVGDLFPEETEAAARVLKREFGLKDAQALSCAVSIVKEQKGVVRWMIEWARSFYVRMFQSREGYVRDNISFRTVVANRSGGHQPPRVFQRIRRIVQAARRFRYVQFHNLDYRELLRGPRNNYPFNEADFVQVWDPPWVRTVRSGKMYKYEMQEPEQHVELCRQARGQDRAMVMIIGAPCKLYRDHLEAYGWERRDKTNASSAGGKKYTVSVWLSPALQARLSKEAEECSME